MHSLSQLKNIHWAQIQAWHWTRHWAYRSEKILSNHCPFLENFFNCSIIALQYHVDFCHTTMWISHNYIYTYSLPLSLVEVEFCQWREIKNKWNMNRFWYGCRQRYRYRHTCQCDKCNSEKLGRVEKWASKTLEELERKISQVEETAGAKPLRQKHVWLD